MMLSVKNLTVSYGNKTIINDLSFDMNEGEILGILGANGTGKSTICLAIAGLIEDKANLCGSIEILGKNINNMTVAEKADLVGIIFQDPDTQLFSPTVEDEIAFAPENLCLNRQVIKDRIDYALKLCAIEHLRHRKTNALSGGEKQLVAIASVLAMRPKILIADEVTAHIDSFYKSKIYNALIAHAKEGAVIFVTPQSEDAELCTRKIWLSKNYENKD